MGSWEALRDAHFVHRLVLAGSGRADADAVCSVLRNGYTVPLCLEFEDAPSAWPAKRRRRLAASRRLVVPQLAAPRHTRALRSACLGDRRASARCSSGASRSEIVDRLHLASKVATRHSNDPSDPQMEDLATLIGSYQPDVVLVEGGRWPLIRPVEAAITRYGELAYASNLARALGIRVDESDPPLTDEIAHVVERQGADRARLLYALRMVPQFIRTSSEPGDIATRLERWLRSAEMKAISGSDKVITIDDLERMCQRELPKVSGGPCWSVWGGSQWTGTWLDEVRETSSTFRDRYTLDRVLEQYLASRRVVVVAGLAHLDAMRAAFRAELQRRRPS